jgi:thiamine-phosphate pyrophosphorylase
MLKRHSPVDPHLPRLWLMTDERMGDALLPSIAALPRGAGVIFRHYGLAKEERSALFNAVERIARKRRLVLLIGGSEHGRHRSAITAPVHSVPERIAAERAGAQLLFVSPVFSTQSHPGARALGRVGFGRICRGARRPVIALGGMTRDRAKGLRQFGIYGWAAIDALSTNARSIRT